jgi:hypothetical protein
MSRTTAWVLRVCVAWLGACQGEPNAPRDAPAPADTPAAPGPPTAPTPQAAPAAPATVTNADAQAIEPPPVPEDFEVEAEATIHADNYAAQLEILEHELGARPAR